MTIPLIGTGNADFIRIYAARTQHQSTENSAEMGFATATMLPEKTASTLSGSQKLGWLALAAALLLAFSWQITQPLYDSFATTAIIDVFHAA